MAINSITSKADHVLPTTSNTKKGKAENPPLQNTGSVQDKIDIAAITQEIKNAFDSTSVINEDKIAAVKAALENGQYQIDADSIAEKILQIDRHFDST